MLEESIDFAEQDFALRQVIEARTEADSIVVATEKALRNASEGVLPNDERRTIVEAVAELREATAGEDYKTMRVKIDALNAATEHLAEVLMNGALSTALEGKSLDEF
jgi:molecular chaperone DnaK (HSP70)